MRRARARILLTGFRPFGGQRTNSSEQVVALVAPAPPTDVDVVTLVLPVEYSAAFEPVRDALSSGRFDAVLHLGLAAGRDAPEFERFALNWRGAAHADEAGVRIAGEPIEPGGPAACMATLPVEDLAAAFAAAGVPCRTSSHAGTFLCNQTLYQTLRLIDRLALRARAGFLHLPSPEADPSRPRIPDLARGVTAALGRIAGLDPVGRARPVRAAARTSRTAPRRCR